MSNEDLTTHLHAKSCIQGATTSLATLRGSCTSKPGSLLYKTQQSILASEAGQSLLSLFSNIAKEETDSVTNQDENAPVTQRKSAILTN